MQRVLRALVLSVATTTLASCATMVNGTSQDINLTSIPAGTVARIEPGGQTVTTPGNARLARKTSYVVTFEHDGYASQNAYLDRQTSDAVWGNILLGGLIGLA